MKTTTSLVVTVIVASVLDEGLSVMVVHWGVVKLCQQVVEVAGQLQIVNRRGQRPPAGLQLTV